MNSKILVLSTIFLSSMFFAPNILAVNSARVTKAQERSEYFCGKISEYALRITQRLNDSETKLSDRRLAREKEMIQNRAGRDTKLADFRSEWDNNRQEQYLKLDEKAETDEEKAAVAKFKASVEEAIGVRKVAVDIAIDEFRTAVNTILNEREVDVDKRLEEYKSSLNSAVESVQNQCSASTDAGQIRLALVRELKQTRDTFKDDVGSYGEIRSEVEALRKIRDEKMRKALNVYKASLEEARRELKLAFK